MVGKQRLNDFAESVTQIQLERSKRIERDEIRDLAPFKMTDAEVDAVHYGADWVARNIQAGTCPRDPKKR